MVTALDSGVKKTKLHLVDFALWNIRVSKYFLLFEYRLMLLALPVKLLLLGLTEKQYIEGPRRPILLWHGISTL
jgi:hypothetical protein